MHGFSCGILFSMKKINDNKNFSRNQQIEDILDKIDILLDNSENVSILCDQMLLKFVQESIPFYIIAEMPAEAKDNACPSLKQIKSLKCCLDEYDRYCMVVFSDISHLKQLITDLNNDQCIYAISSQELLELAHRFHCEGLIINPDQLSLEISLPTLAKSILESEKTE